MFNIGLDEDGREKRPPTCKPRRYAHTKCHLEGEGRNRETATLYT